MAIRATPSDIQNYSHMISLSDGVTTIGLNAVNREGSPDVKALQRQPYPRSTLAVGNASGQLSERRAPFGEFSRSDWSGGLGMDDGEKDATRYYFAKRVMTHIPGKAMLSPMTHYSVMVNGTVNYPGQLSNLVPLSASAAPGTTTIKDAATYNDAIAIKVTAPTGFICTGASVLGEIIGNTAGGGSLQLTLCLDDAGSPGAPVIVFNALTPMIGQTWYTAPYFATALSAADYWLVMAISEGQFVLAKYGTSGTVKTRAYTGGAWSSASGTPVFELCNVGEMDDAKFFVYKNQQYLVGASGVLDTSRTAGTPTIWQNGYRGATDSNSGNLGRLIDNAATFVTGETPAIARVWDSASLGRYEFREVGGVLDTHTLLMSSPWLSAQSATTGEYAVEGQSTWNAVAGHGATKFMDVAVSDRNVIYIAQGEGVAIRRIREYNNGGTWTLEAAADGTNKADLLLAAYDQKSGHVIWRARNTETQREVAMGAAASWGTDLTFGSEIAIGGRDEIITGMIWYDGKLAVLQSGSVWMILNQVPDRLSANLKSGSLTNGRNPEIMPPYLILPYNNGIERLYNNLLEDFGPEKDAGLPYYHGGIVTDSEAIPGGLLITKDGGTSIFTTSPGTGDVFLYRNGGWHPVTSLAWKHQPLAITVRKLEGNRDLLWAATRRGAAGMWWPREWDYSVHDDQVRLLEQDGYLVTGWFDVGSKTLEKYWEHIAIFAEGLSTTETITVYYQTTDQAFGALAHYEPETAGAWTLAGSTSGSTTQQEISLRVTSRRIRFLLRLKGDGTNTPVLVGYNVEYLARVKSAAVYPINIRVSDKGVDREAQEETLDATAMVAQLDAWADAITPLTMHCILEAYDNKYVLIEKPGVRPIWLDAPMAQEAEFASLSIIEVKDI